MDRERFIWWLVKLHVDENLPASIRKSPHGLELEGVIIGRDGMPLEQGNGENNSYNGLLFITNGVSTLNSLIRKGWVPEDDYGEIEGFRKVNGYEEFSNYIKEKQRGRGEGTAYAFSAEKDAMTLIPEFRNVPQLPFYRRAFRKLLSSLRLSKKKGLTDSLPKDFLDVGGEREVTSADIGTKTRVAIRAARDYPHVNTFEIRRTPYGSLGMGAVVEFDKYGIREMVYLDVRDKALAYLEPDKKIVAIHRSYRDGNGKPFKDGEGRLASFVERYITRDELNARVGVAEKMPALPPLPSLSALPEKNLYGRRVA